MRDWVEWVAGAYQEAHPNVTIVTEERTDADIFTAFEAAAAAGEGPDIAPQWAGMPVMAPVWAGDVAPLSDYIDQSEMEQWLNIGENEFDGKIWAAPIYVVGQPLAYNKELFREAGLDPEQAIETFDELLEACEALKGAGITPFVGGNRIGYEGTWVFAQLGKQIMDSPDDLKAYILGERDWAEFRPWAERFTETVERGCWNEDVSSLELAEKYPVFQNGEAAMVWAIDGAVLESAEALGAENVGVMKTPVLARARWRTGTPRRSRSLTSSPPGVPTKR
jgi:raffinose/stachyose/melibiose transport system substrate-binding protein